MVEKGHLNYFTVGECGFYKFNSERCEGCALEETFDLISSWVKGRKLVETLPYSPTSNKPKCYCKDIYKDAMTKDFVLVLWKSDTTKSGNILAVPEDQVSGSGNVLTQSAKFKGKNVIWGRPCYYWIIPEHNAVVSIKFDHSLTDAELFEKYVKKCITNRVKLPNRKKESLEGGAVKITHEKDGTRQYYKFGINMMSLSTSSAQLNLLASRVTHIVHREMIRVASNDEKATWLRTLGKTIPIVAAKPKAKMRKIVVEVEAKPSATEIKKIIEDNMHLSQDKSDYDNVGFRTDRGVTWVDSYRLTDSLVFSGINDNYINAQDVYEKIKSERSSLLRALRRDNEKSSTASGD